MTKIPNNSISPHILPLLHEVTAVLLGVFGQKVTAIYVAGSYAQGCARPESDIDFYVILNGGMSAEERLIYAGQHALLNKRWAPDHVYRVDIDHLRSPYAHDYVAIRRRVILQLTGNLLYGEPIVGNVTAEYPAAVIAAAFREWHVAYIPTLSFYDPALLPRTFARRALAKYMLRELEWIAVLSGAPISCTTAEFVTHIQQYTPESALDAQLSWDLYQKPYITDEELAVLQAKQARIMRRFIARVDGALPSGRVLIIRGNDVIARCICSE